MTRLGLTAAALALLAAPAAAQDLIVYGGGELEYLTEGGGDDGGDSLRANAYVEGELSGFYAGLWGQIDSVAGADEINLYLGYRRSLDSGFSYDLNYTRYIYPEDGGDCCGEIGFVVGQTIGDQFAVSGELYWDPMNELGSAYVGGEFYATDALTFSANYGTYNVEAASDEQEWDAGMSYSFTDTVAADLRYYDGTEYDGYFGVSVTFDTTLLGG